jgi:hypothetical protein
MESNIDESNPGRFNSVHERIASQLFHLNLTGKDLFYGFAFENERNAKIYGMHVLEDEASKMGQNALNAHLNCSYNHVQRLKPSHYFNPSRNPS